MDIFRSLKGLILAVLLTASFNFCIINVLPENVYEQELSTDYYIDQQDLLVIPISDRQTTNSFQNLIIKTISCSTCGIIWKPLFKNKVTGYPSLYQGLQGYKEYPFIVLVRKLRI